MKNITNKYIKAGTGYTIGNILLKGINFLSIPIFTRLMSAESFGNYNVYLSYESVLFIIMGLAIHSCVKNAKYDLKEDYDSFLCNMVYLQITSFFIFFILMNIFSTYICTLLDIDILVLNCLVFHSFTTSLLNFYISKISLEYEYKKYLLISFFNTLLNVSISILLILTFFKNDTFSGRVIGTTFSMILLTFYILFYFLKGKLYKINFDYWKYGLTISLPIVPHGISQIILSSFDRIMIKHYSGALNAGVYSISYTIGSILQVFINSIDNVWTPWFFEKMEKEEDQLIRNKSILYIFLVSIITIFLSIISPEIVDILAPKNYSESKEVIPIVLLGIYFSLIYSVPSNLEYYMKKTTYIAIGTLCAAFINIFLNIVFINVFGWKAAAYTTAFTYALYFYFHLYISWKIGGSKIFDLKMINIIILATVFIILITMLTLKIMYLRILFLFIIVLIIFLIYLYNRKKTIK